MGSECDATLHYSSRLTSTPAPDPDLFRFRVAISTGGGPGAGAKPRQAGAAEQPGPGVGPPQEVAVEGKRPYEAGAGPSADTSADQPSCIPPRRCREVQTELRNTACGLIIQLF